MTTGIAHLGRHVPRLEFRRDVRSTEQLQLDDIFENLALERESDRALQAPAAAEQSAAVVGNITGVEPLVVT